MSRTFPVSALKVPRPGQIRTVGHRIVTYPRRPLGALWCAGAAGKRCGVGAPPLLPPSRPAPRGACALGDLPRRLCGFGWSEPPFLWRGECGPGLGGRCGPAESVRRRHSGRRRRGAGSGPAEGTRGEREPPPAPPRPQLTLGSNPPGPRGRFLPGPEAEGRPSGA